MPSPFVPAQAGSQRNFDCHHRHARLSVALGMKPPKFLQPGDVVTLGIEGLGEQRQKVVAAK